MLIAVGVTFTKLQPAKTTVTSKQDLSIHLYRGVQRSPPQQPFSKSRRRFMLALKAADLSHLSDCFGYFQPMHVLDASSAHVSALFSPCRENVVQGSLMLLQNSLSKIFKVLPSGAW